MFKKSIFVAFALLLVLASFGEAQLMRRGRQQIVGYQYYLVPVRQQQQNCPNNNRYQPRQQVQRISPQYQAMLQQQQCQARQMQLQYDRAMAERQAMLRYQQQLAPNPAYPQQYYQPNTALMQPQVAQAQQPVELKGSIEPVKRVPVVMPPENEATLVSGESPIEILAPGETGIPNESVIPSEISPDDAAPAIEPPLEGPVESILENVIEGNDK